MRTFRRLTIPQSAHPLVRRLFEEMNRQQIGVLDVAERAGINKNTFRSWRTKHAPTIDNLDACFNVLGLELTLKRTKEQN